MNHRRKKSSLDAFYPYSTLKAPKPKKKSKKNYHNIFLFMYTFFQNLFWRVGGLFVHDWDRPCLKSLHLKKKLRLKKRTYFYPHSLATFVVHTLNQIPSLSTAVVVPIRPLEQYHLQKATDSEPIPFHPLDSRLIHSSVYLSHHSIHKYISVKKHFVL